MGEWWDEFTACSAAIQDAQKFSTGIDANLRKRIELLEDYPNLSPGQVRAVLGLKSCLKYLLDGESMVVPCSTRIQDFQPIQDVLSEGLKGAIASYEAAARSGVDAGPFVIHNYVSYCAFEEWYKKQESTWRIAFRFLDCYGGVALLYGDPSFLHEAVAGWFGDVLKEQAVLLSQGPVSSMVNSLGSSRIILPTGLHKEPDFSMLPRKWKERVPPWVGEVAYSNESEPVLREELIEWTLPGGAEIAYGVKVKKIEDSLYLRFIERRQGDIGFSRDIDFSPSNCTRAGDPAFQVQLHLARLFQGVTSDQRLLDGVVTFDLFQLQQLVVELLENSAVDFVWHPQRSGKHGTD